MRKTFLAGSALALVMGIGPAGAADLTAPVYKAAVAPAWNWSGFYLGLNAGAITDHGDIRERMAGNANGLFENTNSDSFQKTGFIGGGQVGYNWQTGQTVVGVEADAAWSNLKNTHETINDPFFMGKTTSARFTSQIDWLATFRGRVGIAATPELLLYVTGGAAAAGVKVSYESFGTIGLAPPSPSFIPPSSTSWNKTAFGWTAGFGAEYALGSHWSVKGEYLHVALDSSTVNFPINLAAFSLPGTAAGSIKVNNNLDLIRVGLNYKL
jgi:outer membrane immunogenic protein